MENNSDDSVSARYIYMDKLPNVHQHIHLLGESPEETRFKAMRQAFREAVSNADNNKRSKKISIEIMQQMHVIESYGFEFAPSLYVAGLLEHVETLIQKLNKKEKQND